VSTIDNKDYDDDEWLKLLYAEGWNQLVHEDNLVESRNRFYHAIQAALIAITGVVSTLLIQLENQDFALRLLGAVLMLSGFSLILITFNWRRVMLAGKKYAHFWRVHLCAIEKLRKIDGVGLASVELRWRQHLNEKKESNFYFFPKITEISNFKMDKDNRSEYWTVMSERRLFVGWIVIGVAVFVCGIALIFYRYLWC
jgi:hypothetical protein